MALSRRRSLFALLAGAGAVAASSIAAGAAIKANAPSNTSPPTIDGTATQGQDLSSTTGDWKGSMPLTYAYQWRRCDKNGGSCSGISGATASTYTLKNVDVGLTLRGRVTATNSAGSSSSTSVPSAVVAAAASTTTTTPAPPATGCPSGTG